MHQAHPHALPAAVGMGIALTAAPQAATAASVAHAFQSTPDGRTLVPLTALRSPSRATAAPARNPAPEVDVAPRPVAGRPDPAAADLLVPASGDMLIGPPEPDEVTATERGLGGKTAPPPADPFAKDQPTPVNALFPAGRVELPHADAPQVVDFLDTLRRDSPVYQFAFGPARPRPDATQPLAPDADHPDPVHLTLPPDA